MLNPDTLEPEDPKAAARVHVRGVVAHTGHKLVCGPEADPRLVVMAALELARAYKVELDEEEKMLAEVGVDGAGSQTPSEAEGDDEGDKAPAVSPRRATRAAQDIEETVRKLESAKERVEKMIAKAEERSSLIRTRTSYLTNQVRAPACACRATRQSEWLGSLFCR